MEGVPTKIRGRALLHEMTACKQLLKIIWKTVDVPGAIRPQIKYCLVFTCLMYCPFLIHTTQRKYYVRIN